MAAKAYRSEPSVESYIGRWINLISTRRVRYEGIFHYVHPEGSFIGIRNVRCCGSEGRKTGRQVPASEEVSDILFFRVSDIENIMVEPLPPVQTSPPHNDPVIIELKQPRNSSMSSASTQGSRTISDPSFRAVQLSRPWSTFQERLPIYRAGKNIESRGIVPPVSNSYESGIPMTWQEIYALTSGPSHFPRTHIHPTSPGLSISHSLPQHAHISNVNLLSSSGIRSFNKAASPSPPPVSSNSNLVSTSVQNPNAYSLFTTTPFSEFFPPHASPATLSPTQASLFASESSLNWMPNISLVNSHSTSVFGFDYPLEPPLGYINASEASVPQNSNSSPNDPSNEAAPSFPFQTISQSMLSDISSLRSIQSNTSLPLVSSGHLQHPSDSMLLSSPLVQTIHEYAKYKAQEPTEPLAYELSPPAASMKEPLPKHPSYSMPFSSSHVPNIHDDSMFKSREPKISESLTYEHPSPAKFMKEPLLPLPRQSSSSMLLRSPEVHTILENTKLKGQEPKIKSESGPWMYKLPPQAPQATAMKEPLFPLPNVAHKGLVDDYCNGCVAY